MRNPWCTLWCSGKKWKQAERNFNLSLYRISRAYVNLYVRTVKQHLENIFANVLDETSVNILNTVVAVTS